MKNVCRTICAGLLAVLLAFGAAGCAFSREEAPDFSGEAQELADGSPFKHYFRGLDNTEKHAYNAILSGVRSYPQRIAVPTLTNEQLSRTYTALLYDNPELFFLSRSSAVRQNKGWAYFLPKYEMGRDDYEAMLKKCADVADRIVEEASQKATAFEKELLIHDKLIAMCRYSENESLSFRDTVYGVLCGGSASCEGYAKTAKYLLDRLRIPCYVVIGQSTPPGSSTQTHMWNIVELNDRYYHLDLTWDDPVLESGQNLIRHTYFNVSDSAIARTHAGYSGTDACASIDDNYFVYKHLLFADWDDAERERSVEIAAQSIQAGSEGFQLRFSNETAFDKAMEDLFGQSKNGVNGILQQVREKVGKSFAIDHTSYVQDKENYIIDVILEK